MKILNVYRIAVCCNKTFISINVTTWSDGNCNKLWGKGCFFVAYGFGCLVVLKSISTIPSGISARDNRLVIFWQTVLICYLVTHYNNSGKSSTRDYNLKYSNYITVTNPSNALLLLHLGVNVLAFLSRFMMGWYQCGFCMDYLFSRFYFSMC